MSEFTAEAVERGHRYHRPRYVSMLVDFALSVVVLASLALTGLGDALLPGTRWWVQALVFPAIVLTILELVHLPVAYWRDHLHEKRWELTNQTPRGWLADVGKAFAISIVLSTILFVPFVWIARSTDAWPWIVAPAAAAFAVVLTFVAPVVLEPIFNRFEPLADEQLADDLRALSVAAGVPVRDVLVADASRRTNKSNAYVSGFGATRRVVVFDTLLRRAKPAELKAVLAHELAHRKYRDVLMFTLLFVVATFAIVALLWAILRDDARDPVSFAQILLVLALVQPPLFAALAAVMRRWEYRADRFALLLTRDLRALEQTFGHLVDANVADLEPPRAVYYLKFTHPTPPERIAALRATAAAEGLTREEAA